MLLKLYVNKKIFADFMELFYLFFLIFSEKKIKKKMSVPEKIKKIASN